MPLSAAVVRASSAVASDSSSRPKPPLGLSQVDASRRHVEQTVALLHARQTVREKLTRLGVAVLPEHGETRPELPLLAREGVGRGAVGGSIGQHVVRTLGVTFEARQQLGLSEEAHVSEDLRARARR